MLSFVRRDLGEAASDPGGESGFREGVFVEFGERASVEGVL